MRIKLTGLWVNTDSKGNEYLGGPLGSNRLTVIKNGYKQTDKEPDYICYIETKEKEFLND